MKGKLYLYYDKEGDFLEINIGKYTKGYFKDVGHGIAERIDEKSGKVTGLAVLGFKKRTGNLKDVQVSLPLKIKLTN